MGAAVTLVEEQGAWKRGQGAGRGTAQEQVHDVIASVTVLHSHSELGKAKPGCSPGVLPKGGNFLGQA